MSHPRSGADIGIIIITIIPLIHAITVSVRCGVDHDVTLRIIFAFLPIKPVSNRVAHDKRIIITANRAQHDDRRGDSR